jgi:hypothetical protein
VVGAVEVQLQRVDGFQTQLGGPDGGQPVGACGLVELVEQRGVGRLELDGVAVGFEPGRVAGLGAADQVEGPVDQDERHGPSNCDAVGTLHEHGKQQEGSVASVVAKPVDRHPPAAAPAARHSRLAYSHWQLSF